MIILIFWLLLSAGGSIVLGLAAYRMVRIGRRNWLAPAEAWDLGSRALQHAGIAWLAYRVIENYRGGPLSPIVVPLTLVQLLVTVSGIHLAAKLLGWIGRPEKESGDA